MKDRSNSRVRQEERQTSHSARSQKTNIVSARSQGNPKVNDVSINSGAMGITVKPCNIYKGNELTTWRRIGQEKDQTREATFSNSKDIRAEDLVSFERNDRIEEFPSKELLEENTLRLAVEDPFKNDAGRVSSRSGSMGCSTATSKLNRTYSFRDSVCDGMNEVLMSQRKWKPVRHSPRIEFCFDDPDKVNRSQPLSLGFTSPKKVTLRNDSGKSCTNSKAKNVGKERSKHSLIKDEINRFEKDSNQKDSDLEGSRMGPSDGSLMKSSLERKGSRPATFSKTGSSENLQNSNNLDSSDLSKNFGESSAIVDNELIERVSVMEDQNLSNFESLKCGPASNRNLNAKMKNIDESLMDPEPKLGPLTSKQSSYSDKFNSLTSFDKSDVTVNEICEQKVNESILSNTNKGTNEIEGVENIAGKNFDFNSSGQNMAESFEDQLEKSSSFFSKNEVFNNIENEPDVFLIKDILRPSRSSTPFDKIDKIEGNPHCPMHEVQNKKSRVPFANCEWKMSVDTERGAEMLYRVEAKDSNRLNTSVHDNELQEANFENEPSKLKVDSSNRSSVSSKTIDIAQSVAGAATDREQKKDTASQINICNCSLKISAGFSNEEVINDSVEKNPDLEEQVYDDSLQTKSAKSQSILEKSSERQTSVKTDVEKIDPGVKRREGSKMKLNTSFIEPWPTSEQYVDNDDLKNRSRLFIEPSNEAENEEVQEIYKNFSTKDFDYDSDNTVDDQIAEDDADFKTPSKSDKIDVRNFRSILLSESRVELKKSLTSRSTALRSRTSRTLEIENRVKRVHEDLSVLNDSSDSSASSADAMDFTNVKQVESVEVETIEEIGTRNRSIRFRILPEIRKSNSMMVKERHSERHKLGAETYWEKARRAAKSRLISLDPPCQGARFLKKNPKVCVLPPVPSNTSLIRCR